MSIERRSLSARAKIATALGIVAFFVLAGTGVASASWTALTTATGTVSAATTGVTLTPVSGTSTLDTGATPYKFAGTATNSPSLLRSIVLKNSGTTPLTYTISATDGSGIALAAGTSAISITLWTASSPCTKTVGTGSTTGSLAALPAFPAASATQASGASVTLCILTKLGVPVAQAQGLSVTAILTVKGTVGTSGWNAGASDVAFTQVVYRVANPTAPACKQTGFLNTLSTISWTAPTGTTGTVSYSIVDAATGASIPGATITGTTAQFAYGALLTATQTVLVRASESGYGTTSVGLPFTLSQSAGLAGILFSSVSCVTPAAS